MSVIVFGGAAQFAAVGYVASGLAWPGVVLLTALLNARHLLYSAALGPWLREVPFVRRAVMAHLLSLTPFRRIVKDYFLICDSYYKAIRTSTPSQIEAIDMGRRGLHNEGAELLVERLKEKIEIDFDTARRLFTLICVLHWKG